MLSSGQFVDCCTGVLTVLSSGQCVDCCTGVLTVLSSGQCVDSVAEARSELLVPSACPLARCWRVWALLGCAYYALHKHTYNGIQVVSQGLPAGVFMASFTSYRKKWRM